MTIFHRVLIDTSVWIKYFEKSDARVTELIECNNVVIHPDIVGELAVGNLSPSVLADIKMFPTLLRLPLDETLQFIQDFKLAGKGLSIIDVNLAASAMAYEVQLLTDDHKLKREWVKING